MGKSPRELNRPRVAVPNADWLVKPSYFFIHPDEVLADPSLWDEEKRALLAAWASDAHAVEGRPTLRQLDSGAIVPVSEILAALRSLDENGDVECG